MSYLIGDENFRYAMINESLKKLDDWLDNNPRIRMKSSGIYDLLEAIEHEDEKPIDKDFVMIFCMTDFGNYPVFLRIFNESDHYMLRLLREVFDIKLVDLDIIANSHYGRHLDYDHVAKNYTMFSSLQFFLTQFRYIDSVEYHEPHSTSVEMIEEMGKWGFYKSYLYKVARDCISNKNYLADHLKRPEIVEAVQKYLKDHPNPEEPINSNILDWDDMSSWNFSDTYYSF